jgi:XRE family aerobic/anaerobic benzoate catabolism transcriptional regulator
MDPLAELGARIVSLRRARDLSRAELARRAGLSDRFLADVESGRGNIAFSRLLDLCAALEAPLSLLASDLEPSGARGGTAALRQSILESLRRASRAELEEARRWLERRELARRAVVALVGLRGAGKTTLGRRVAARLRARFVELDERVEKKAGLRLADIFELHGEEYYRRVELEALREFLADGRRAVLASGGGLVTRAETYDLLRAQSVTFWLKADPKDHWNRVLAQDPRPMANYPNAFAQLERLLQRRAPLYALADFTIDTTALGIDEAVRLILEAARTRLMRVTTPR